MAEDTPRTNEVWATADYDSHRRGTCEKLERELNEANLVIAKFSQRIHEITIQLGKTNAEHRKKYQREQRYTTTPDAS